MKFEEHHPNLLLLPHPLVPGDCIDVIGVPAKVLEVAKLKSTLHGDAIFVIVHTKVHVRGDMTLMAVLPRAVAKKQKAWTLP